MNCPEGKKCIIRKDQPKCVCAPDCSKKKKGPLCGTDGRTYRHYCQLLKRSCRKNKPIQVAYYGPCQSKCALEDASCHRCFGHCCPTVPVMVCLSVYAYSLRVLQVLEVSRSEEVSFGSESKSSLCAMLSSVSGDDEEQLRVWHRRSHL